MSQEEVRQETPTTPETGDQAEGKISRRKLMIGTTVGIMLAVPLGTATWRNLSKKEKLIFDFVGPFKKYGRFLPKSFGVEGEKKFIKILFVRFLESTHKDTIHIAFTCIGDEVENRKILISISAYDMEKRSIAAAENIYEDPRIAGRREQIYVTSMKRYPSSESLMILDLPHNVRIDNVGLLRVMAEEELVS